MVISTLNNTLLGQVLQETHAAFAEHSTATHAYLTPQGTEALDALTARSLERVSAFAALTAKGGDKAQTDAVHQRFTGIVESLKLMFGTKGGDRQVKELSRALAVESLITNAVDYATRAHKLAADKKLPQQQIATFLQDYMKSEGASAATLAEKMNGIVISLVHTIHPTIYHTAEARIFEGELIKLLEDPAMLQENVTPPRLSPAGQERLKAFLAQSAKDGFIGDLIAGKAHITPMYKVTPDEETRTEADNLLQIKERLQSVVGAWNAAVKQVLPNDAAKLEITPERAQSLFEIRTWGRSADADGRKQATSQFLYESIRASVDEQGNYTGPILDFRQNRKVHEDVLSALIQVKYRNSATGRYGEGKGTSENGGQPFHEFCDEFMASKQKKYQDNRKHYFDLVARADIIKESQGESAYQAELAKWRPWAAWRGPLESILQQLTPDDRAEFLRLTVQKNYRLVPQQHMSNSQDFFAWKHPGKVAPSAEDSGQAVTGDFYDFKQAFFKRYEQYITDAKGLDGKPRRLKIPVGYSDMIHVTIPFDLNNPDPNGVKVSLRAAWDATVKLNGWELEQVGLGFKPLLNAAADKPVLDFWRYTTPEQLLVQNLLQGTRRPNKKQFGAVEEIDPMDRVICSDSIKRMVVMKEAMSKYQKNGTKVADRYQIANFSSAADFMALLKLFQETGLVETGKDGAVIKADLGIMPLLETKEDLDNAKAIFEKLLKDPVAKSFWKARGFQVDVMVGFSDGAASAGNFASQWQIYQAIETLNQLFSGVDTGYDGEGKKNPPFKLRVLQGRGRGVDRGGTVDPSLQFDLMPPSLTKQGIYDATIQSDLPMDMAASPAYGADYFTKLLVGNLRSVLMPHQLDSAIKDSISDIEHAISKIAYTSSEIYNRIVRKNPDARLFLNSLPDNTDRSSRDASRNPDNWDDIRAISKEYKELGSGDVPLKNVGLLSALKNVDAKLGEKLMKFPFFQAMTKVVRVGMESYDPAVAMETAKTVKKEPFMQQVAQELNQLGSRLNSLLGRDPKRAPQPAPGEPSQYRRYLDHNGHGVLLAGLQSSRLLEPSLKNEDQADWAEAQRNALFATAQEISKQNGAHLHEQEITLAA